MERNCIFINGKPTNYYIDRFARITNRNNMELRKHFVNNRLYFTFRDSGVEIATKRVDYLVADEFLPRPDDAVRLIHIDGSEFNCEADNLYWLTARDIIETNINNGMDPAGLIDEIWKTVNTDAGPLDVSTFGRVRNTETKAIIEPKDSHGYKVLYYTTKDPSHTTKVINVHRLVADAFIPNPQHYNIVNHLDNKHGNNKISNLEWCNVAMNTEHGALMVGHDRLSSKPLEKAVKLMSEGKYSDVQISEMTGINRKTLSDIRCGRRHPELLEKYPMPAKRWSKELKNDMISLIRRGYSKREIFDKLGITQVDQATTSFYERARRSYNQSLLQ